MKFYISFGQVHTHSINGVTIDKDCVVEIEADSRGAAHEKAMIFFDGVFHNVYTEPHTEYFPRGVVLSL